MNRSARAYGGAICDKIICFVIDKQAIPENRLSVVESWKSNLLSHNFRKSIFGNRYSRIELRKSIFANEKSIFKNRSSEIVNGKSIFVNRYSQIEICSAIFGNRSSEIDIREWKIDIQKSILGNRYWEIDIGKSILGNRYLEIDIHKSIFALTVYHSRKRFFLFRLERYAYIYMKLYLPIPAIIYMAAVCEKDVVFRVCTCSTLYYHTAGGLVWRNKLLVH